MTDKPTTQELIDWCDDYFSCAEPSKLAHSELTIVRAIRARLLAADRVHVAVESLPVCRVSPELIDALIAYREAK